MQRFQMCPWCLSLSSSTQSASVSAFTVLHHPCAADCCHTDVWLNHFALQMHTNVDSQGSNQHGLLNDTRVTMYFLIPHSKSSQTIRYLRTICFNIHYHTLSYITNLAYWYHLHSIPTYSKIHTYSVGICACVGLWEQSGAYIPLQMHWKYVSHNYTVFKVKIK
jgi:hypothetical protein